MPYPYEYKRYNKYNKYNNNHNNDYLNALKWSLISESSLKALRFAIIARQNFLKK